MSDFVTVQIDNNSVIAGGDTLTIPFRPGHAGPVTIRSTPHSQPSHSELGLIGTLAIRSPASSKPLALVRVPLHTATLVLNMQVTDAELATPGMWSASVSNGTEVDLTFDTTVTYLDATPLDHRTATFDVGLLNLIIAEAVHDAAVTWHLQSSASEDEHASRVTWSDAVAAFLGGQTELDFRIPDIRIEHNFDVGDLTLLVLRIENFDSDPDAPVVAFVTADDVGTPQVEVVIPFLPDTAKIVAVDSDVNLDGLDIEADVSSLEVDVALGFSGVLSATSSGAGELHVAGNAVYDLGSDLSLTVPQNLNGVLGGLAPATVRHTLDTFFIGLMRLGPKARIDRYLTDGTTLTVAYSVPVTSPTPPVKPPTVKAPPAAPVVTA